MKVYLVYFNELEEFQYPIYTLRCVFSSLELASKYVYSNRSEEYSKYGESGCFSIHACELDKEVE